MDVSTSENSQFLDRYHCLLLRGLAIFFIVFHNFFHFYTFVPENEFGFDADNLSRFLMHFKTESPLFIIGDVFSFLGWLGVSVFVFLSGYGLVRKYEKSGSALIVRDYLWHSWKKLILLMLPGVLLFVLMNLGNSAFILRSFFSLTLLSNITAVYTDPGVYWYFGLTFELYLLYILFYHNRSWKLLAGIVVLAIAAQLLVLLSQNSDVLYWFMHNLTGWVLDFILGIMVARSGKLSWQNLSVWKLLMIAIVAGGLFVVCNSSKYLWLFIHLFAIVFFVALSLIIHRTRYLKKCFMYLGSLSSFLFVMHPVARSIVVSLFSTDYALWIRILAYLTCTFVGVYLFKYLYYRHISKYL